MDALIVAWDEAGPSLFAGGAAAAQFELMKAEEAGIDPARAERFGTEFVEALDASRSGSEAVAAAWQDVAVAAPDEIAAETGEMVAGYEAIPQAVDERLADLESVTDWPAYLDATADSQELMASLFDSTGGPSGETEEAIRVFVLEECGLDLDAELAFGGSGAEEGTAGSETGNAEQAEELFNDEASREQVVSAFAERLGLTVAESECFLGTVDFDALGAMEAGSEAATSDVIAALSACGIDASSLS